MGVEIDDGHGAPLLGCEPYSYPGQRRRLDIGLALIGDPELLFLDEPTTGFDPKARREAWEVIDGLRRLGTTIVLRPTRWDEADRIAFANWRLSSPSRLADALHRPYSPTVHGLAIAWTDTAVLGLWAAAGLAVSLRRFSSVPGATA